MDISIFGYKLNLEILILIGVVYLILVGHTFCGCCNFGMMEGFDVSGNTVAKEDPVKVALKKTNLATQSTAGGSSTADDTPVASSSKEGFSGSNIYSDQSSPYNLQNDTPIDTSKWNAPNLTVVPGQPLNADVKKFLARSDNQEPLPEGEMFFFANTKFGPECCPNTYSNSQGCSCMSSQQYNSLITRGGNNVPYSEY
jgi:hypothetical protein